MLNLNEDLKPISYYIKDRERMLQEMFRCVRGSQTSGYFTRRIEGNFDQILSLL